MPKKIDAPRQPTAAMSGAPITATTTVPTLPPAMWALIAKPRRSGGNCSARRPLPTGCCGEPPDPRGDVRDGERRERLRRRLGHEPAAEEQTAGPEDPPTRDPPGQRRVAQLDHPRREGADRGEDRDRLDADPVLVHDLEVDQGQDHRLGVIHGMSDAEQPQRPHRPDHETLGGGLGGRGGLEGLVGRGGLRGRGRLGKRGLGHPVMMRHRWTSLLGHRRPTERGDAGDLTGSEGLERAGSPSVGRRDRSTAGRDRRAPHRSSGGP